MENNNQSNKNLLFELHKIQRTILNLQFSLIYNDFEEKNPQHYINELILTIKNSYNEIKKLNNL